MPAQPPLPSIFGVILGVEYLAGAFSDLDSIGPMLRTNRHSAPTGQPLFAPGDGCLPAKGTGVSSILWVGLQARTVKMSCSTQNWNFVCDQN
jgi:hypothetical protein